MKRTVLIVSLLALAAGAVWLAARGCGADVGDPVERLVAEMVPIPGRDFRMGKYEVTQAQWEAVMGENPSYFKGADHPVECVSWNDCQAFLEKLNAHPAACASGLVFRLPTAEEWETACRAGSTNAYCRLANGTEITEATLGRVAWFGENAATRPRWLAGFISFAERLVNRVHEVDWDETTTHKPVGWKESNAWGLHDMHGNVWEWTETAVGECRVFRGGGWHDSAWDCESSDRSRCSPSFRIGIFGFRLCASGRADTAPASRASGARDGGASRAERGGDSGPSEASAHAESAAPAEPKPHAESAEGAEPEPHAESAESAESAEPGGSGGREGKWPFGVSLEEQKSPFGVESAC